ncbi:MAG: hypothetical protein ACP5PX_04350 [Candidatus Hadarchaeum sp.]|uniref:hypothetical protein n=1 Tax=Candidatus Hadarchaeum sp. TaxID=2883567 RepID=UPI003D109670
MISESFNMAKEGLFKKLQIVAALTPEVENEIIDLYRNRGKRAIEAIKGGRVIKRGQRWFVKGKNDEYEVVKNFCTCSDYVMNIATGKADVDMCYHALAKNICQVLNSYYVAEPEK